ncbi:hypothetical protein LSTR_LSTR004550 [Laodelphax striatellus]|uniref:Uncharacterized protein n=1 Tax=Laodelphax striatellus TaxID=195883 RepID=A0A482WM76_LAOST|nr:hypothetical protein LSTR_LSTR014556 [Laodelphax striatellus]RZF36862.1 hypothetical protein LSTR_LSTR004550 [Laodelphax striatellus]
MNGLVQRKPRQDTDPIRSSLGATSEDAAKYVNRIMAAPEFTLPCHPPYTFHNYVKADERSKKNEAPGSHSSNSAQTLSPYNRRSVKPLSMEEKIP